MVIGQNIREQRKKSNLTQNELAELSGVAVGTISQYERGRRRQPNIAQLKKIADALEVTIELLLNPKAKEIPSTTTQEKASTDIIRCRYQAVYKIRKDDEDNDMYIYSIWHVYLDSNGALEYWEELSPIRSFCFGELPAKPDTLLQDLEFIASDIRKWKPVHFDSLHVGMKFELN